MRVALLRKKVSNSGGRVRAAQTSTSEATDRWLFSWPASCGLFHFHSMRKARIELAAAVINLIAVVVELVTKILF